MEQKVYALFIASPTRKDYAGDGFPEDLIDIHKSYAGMEQHMINFIRKYGDYSMTQQDIDYFRRNRRTRLPIELNMVCMVQYLKD